MSQPGLACHVLVKSRHQAATTFVATVQKNVDGLAELTVLPVLLRQLILIIELYSHYDVYDYLRQIALTLCSDKVSEVRWISYKLVSFQCSCFSQRREDVSAAEW